MSHEPSDPGDAPENPDEVARQILLRRLTDQPRSRTELAQTLAKRHVPEEVATRVLDRFTEVGLIDDAAFAKAWVASRQRGRGLARRALAAELHRKGIDRETAGQALETIDPDDEVESARRLVRRRLPSLARQERVVAQRRLLGLLARKGYPPGLAVAVMRDELRSAEFPAQDAEDRADLRADLRAEEEAAEDAVETELRAP